MDVLPRTASLILMNCYQGGSCLPCEAPSKKPIGIQYFHHRRPEEGIELVTFRILRRTSHLSE